MSIHELFVEFRNNKNEFGHFEQSHALMSKRATLIEKIFKDMGFVPEIHTFNSFGGLFTDISIEEDFYPYNFYNIVVPVYSNENNNKTVFVTAHHDVMNIESDNVNDNTASIVNMIKLAEKIKESNKEFPVNIYFAFTDLEELGGRGAQVLSNRIRMGMYGDVKYIINLELTAHGEYIWAERKMNTNLLRNNLFKFLNGDIEFSGIPFADSVIFNKCGVCSLTIGTLPKTNSGNYDYSVWNICHRMSDNYYDTHDMGKFVDFLFNFLGDTNERY